MVEYRELKNSFSIDGLPSLSQVRTRPLTMLVDSGRGFGVGIPHSPAAQRQGFDAS